MKLGSSLAILSLLLVSACAGSFEPTTPVGSAPLSPPPPGPPRVAILLPLSGPNAAIGATLLKAAQMALSVPGSPELDVKDTAGDPAHAQLAAQQAAQAGDRMILGPLTAPETVAVASIAEGAGLPVLAFTSDPSAAAPGVWTLGLTPGEQMRRLVAAARDDGREHLAAVLPQGPLGDALQTAFSDAAMAAGMEPPVIQRSDPGITGFITALKIVSNYEARHGEVAARIKALQDQTDPASRQEAAELAAKPAAPPPFDALLIGESGPTLDAASGELANYDVVSPQVRVLGPALWAQQAGRLGRMAGAWYASLDATTRTEFAAAYQAKYGITPPSIADFAFDAAAIARVLAAQGDFSPGALTTQEGFSGVDGPMLLLPDGHVRRALAVYQIDAGGGSHIVSPAPQDITQPGA